jgi:hypothetical protein
VLVRRLTDAYLAGQDFDAWYARAGSAWPLEVPAVAKAGAVSAAAATSCPPDDTWSNGSLDHVPEFQGAHASA